MISPSQISPIVGQISSFQAQEMRTDCFNTFGPYNRTGDSLWTTSNSSVATVSGGSVHFLAPGAVTIHGQFTGTVYTNFPSPCQTQMPVVNPGSSGAVVQVTFQKADGSALPSPLRVGISATTLSGTTHDRKQHLRAVVSPAAEAANVILSVNSKLQLSSVSTSGNIITFDVVGLSASASHGDAVITATRSGTSVGTAMVDVIVPHNVSATHDTTGIGRAIQFSGDDANQCQCRLRLCRIPPTRCRYVAFTVLAQQANHRIS